MLMKMRMHCSQAVCVGGGGYLQIADWLYAGPSVAVRACPTCVCVSPKESLRILKFLANSRISSRLMPSSLLTACWGSR